MREDRPMISEATVILFGSDDEAWRFADAHVDNGDLAGILDGLLVICRPMRHVEPTYLRYIGERED
jgi:hypothetical protein